MLNDTKIKNLKPKEKSYFLTDFDNLLIFVRPTGKKSFYYNYYDNKKRKKIKLGDYPAMSLKEARDKRDKIKNQSVIKRLAFSEIYTKWYEIKAPSVSEHRAKVIKGYFERFFLPAFGNKNINDINKSEIIKSLDYYIKGQNYDTFAKALNSLTQVFKYAYNLDLIDNIVPLYIDKSVFIKKPAIKHYACLLDEVKIRALLKSIIFYEGGISVKFCCIFQLLTAVRPSNAKDALWDEIDFNKRLWIIPANKMKNKKEHIIPLSDLVYDLLLAYKEKYKVGEFLFQSRPNRSLSEGAVRTMLRSLGYSKDEITPHGFRGMFSTLANEHKSEHKIGVEIIEMCLAHLDTNKVRASYNHAKNLKEKLELFNWWANYLLRLCPDLNAKTLFLS